MNIPREPLTQGKLHIQNENKPPPSQSSQETKSSTSQGQSSQAKGHEQSSASSTQSGAASGQPSRASSAATQRPLSGRQSQSSSQQNRTVASNSGKPPLGPMSAAGAVLSRRGQESGDASKPAVRMVLEVQRGPTKQEIRDSLNVPEIMDHGGDLS